MKKLFAIVLTVIILLTSFIPVTAIDPNTELIITEICYNSPNSAETDEKDICDYVEIMNISDKEIDLTGAEIAVEYEDYKNVSPLTGGDMKIQPGQIIIVSVVADRETFNSILGCSIDAESFYHVEKVELKNSGTKAQVAIQGSEGIYSVADYNPDKHDANKRSIVFGISESQGYHVMGLSAMTPGEINPELLGLAETEDFTENIKMMTYNICVDGVKSDFPGKIEGLECVQDASLYIEQRYDEIVELILQESPDVLCLCELNKEWWELLKPALADIYDYWGVSSKTGNEVDNLSDDKWDTVPLLLYKKSEFKLVEKGSFVCPPDDRGLTTPDNWAILRKKDTGASFVVMTQHLVAGSEEIRHQARTESAKVIIDEVKKITKELPVVIMGDFNCYEGSDAYKVFLEGGFKDAARMNPDTELMDTCIGFEKKTEQIYTHLPIDIFMLSDGDFNVNSYKVLDTTIESGFAYSDHSPVIIEVEMRTVKTGSGILPWIIAGAGVLVIAVVVVIVVKLKKKRGNLSLEA